MFQTQVYLILIQLLHCMFLSIIRRLSKVGQEKLIRQITDELRDNRRVIDQNQFKENIFRRIRLASYSLHESYQVHQARTRQLKEVFEAAFKRAFVTPGG